MLYRLKFRISFFLFFPLFLLNRPVSAQDTIVVSDTVYHHHSPNKALLMSALVPGLGQIYNNKVWKLPLLYGGAGVSVYLLNYYQDRYVAVRSIMKDIAEKKEAGEIPDQISYIVYGKTIPASSLERAMNSYRRYRDINIFVLGGIYVLNIIDAVVDAYMFEYDISDDLSLEIKPGYFPSGLTSGSVGMTFCLKF